MKASDIVKLAIRSLVIGQEVDRGVGDAMSFIVAPLYTADGGALVTTVRILPYKTMPAAILWGDRLFVKRADIQDKYCEGYCHVVPNDEPEPWDEN